MSHSQNSGTSDNERASITHQSFSMLSVPSSTPSGVPLLTVEQIQQLQRQQHHGVGSAATAAGMGQSPSAPFPPLRHAQFVLGQEVTPRNSNVSSSLSGDKSGGGGVSSGNSVGSGQAITQVPQRESPSDGVGTTTNQAQQSSRNDYESLSDAALWKLFWEEAGAGQTIDNRGASGERTVTSNMALTPPQGNPQLQGAASTYSNETVKVHNPPSRMNSPSPTPSAMSCSTAESKTNHTGLASAVSTAGQHHAQAPAAFWTQMNQMKSGVAPNTSNDPLNMMLQQYYEQQNLLQRQQFMQQQNQRHGGVPQHLQQPHSNMFPSKPSSPPAPMHHPQMDLASHTFSIPSIVMPPSVMTSVMTPPRQESQDHEDSDLSYNEQSQQRRRKQPYKSSSAKQRSKSFRQESPQHCLDRILLQGRGYSPGQLRIKAEAAAYDTTPSPLQLASFGTELVRAIHTSNLQFLSDMLSCGLSPNPCNQFRDSIVDLVCKRANASVFESLVQHGCDLRVCDGFGRTPLHHCCWASTFCPEIAMTILKHDWKQLFVEDKRGQTPLEYVREDLYEEWIEFLQGVVERVVPQQIPSLSPLKLERPDGYLPDPINALPSKLAMALSAGKLSPSQVKQMSLEMKARFEG